MAIKTISLSRLESQLQETLNECARSGETLVVELPDQRLLAIQSLDPQENDSLIDELLDSNSKFRSLVAQSKTSARKPFLQESLPPTGSASVAIEPPMKTLTFPRTGDRPLVTTGEVIARASSKQEKGWLSRYWHDLTLVRTDSGKCIAAIAWRSTFPQEIPSDAAEVLDSLEAVPPALDDYEPTEDVVGYPVAQFEKRQTKLLAEIEMGYRAAVGRLLAAAGIVERV